jgi:xanthine dehydrogenase small subunit
VERSLAGAAKRSKASPDPDHRRQVNDETVQFQVDGRQAEVPDEGGSLLGALRDHLGITSAKDGCSPQGQCGCCTVLVDGAPRVACVTPVRRVRGRSVTTVDGVEASVLERWVEAFVATGASQCGFCTPGILCRLIGQEAKGADLSDRRVIDRALAAHLCRCTGWQTIREAAEVSVELRQNRDHDPGEDALANARATMEGGSRQIVGSDVVLGRAGFSDDTAPAEALVAVLAGEDWVVGESLAEARALAHKVQGRRTTLSGGPPIEVPEGSWDLTLATSWVEPGYLETDASWCVPGGEPVSSLVNGGAFGAKQGAMATSLGIAARALADQYARPVRTLWSREDSVRLGPKRPPLAAGMCSDGTGVVRVARTTGVAAAIAAVLPQVRVEEVDVGGPVTTLGLRAVGWGEAEVLAAGLRGTVDWVRAPGGGRAKATLVDGTIRVEVEAGEALSETVLRSYVIGAAHMGFSWVTSEQLTVDETGEIHDLTIRSFGIVGSGDMVPVDVVIREIPGPAVAVSEAAFVAVAAATWLDRNCPQGWPTG